MSRTCSAGWPRWWSGPPGSGRPGCRLWAHLLALPAAVALGALSSRAVTGSAGHGVAVLARGALVLGLSGSTAPWLAPPVMATARALTGSLAASTALLLSLWAVAWAAVALAGYAWRRRSRA